MELLDELEIDFRTKVHGVLLECTSLGFIIKPSVATRSVALQAKLWIQGHTKAQLAAAIKEFEHNDANFLADVLRREAALKPASTVWATDALPGLSWHNFRPSLAVDVLAYHNNQVIENGLDPAYTAFLHSAENAGLTTMVRLKDYGHVQLNPWSVRDRMALREVDSAMRAYWT